MTERAAALRTCWEEVKRGRAELGHRMPARSSYSNLHELAGLDALASFLPQILLSSTSVQCFRSDWCSTPTGTLTLEQAFVFT